MPKDFSRADFERLAPRYGFEASDYDRPFDHPDGVGDDGFTLVGFNPRARKYHCACRRWSDGTIWYIRPADVRDQMEAGGLEWA